MEALTQIQVCKLVPVVVFEKTDDVLPVLTALKNGGLPIAEITFRTACAAEAVKLAVEQFPDMLIGAGTVINEKQCKQALAAGAKFIVGPGLSKAVARVCKKAEIPYIPGIVTPTEIIRALGLGLTLLKFFPADAFGGLKTIKALSAAFPKVFFMPTGGINADNILEYLAFPKVSACGGSWMMKGSPAEIEANTKSAMMLIHGKGKGKGKEKESKPV